MKRVVVVESPAKAKTINRYLGSDYTVLASYGHIRDLPSKNGSVKPDDDFSMVWEIDERAKKHVAEIAKALQKADELYLATDPDREGEAISWHVQEVLKDYKNVSDKPVKRIVFHEITKNAIQQAVQAPRNINYEMVSAYLARRALDYLVGFTLSPVLWRKLPGAKSAGRVQSVALRIIVDRENEIENFKTQEYWSIVGDFLNSQQQRFTAKLSHLNGKKLDKFDITQQQQAEAVCKSLIQQSYQVATLEKKQVKRHPTAPFTTSTLQQEASRKLGFSAQRTMQVAQKLYEGVEIAGELTGLITYMRTDSIHISTEAITETRQFIEGNFGKNYLPSSPRSYKNKTKNAQEAHEAIRPTSLLRRPQEIAAYLDEAQLKLYELIWKRTVASQMESALFDQVSVEVSSMDTLNTFRATGTTQVFDGFLKLYQEGVDDEQDKDDENRLPILAEGELTPIEKITPNQHFTQPPPRYTEASLVKKLEELGIGRPSTYASILYVLQERDYVRLEKKQFIPEERGRMVTSFLVNFFKRYVEYDFTADMEEQLDEISNGKLPWKSVLSAFWTEFKTTVDGTQSLRISEVLECLERDMSMHLFHSMDESARQCPSCDEGHVSLKLSKFGAFLGCSRYPDCKYTKALSGEAESGDIVVSDEPKVIGNDPVSGEAISLRKGPYGYYLQWDKENQAKGEKPKRVAIPQSVDLASIDLARALQLKELPKVIGVHPETQEPISIGIGKFGPYIKYGGLFVSIPKKEDMFELTIARAVELIAEKQIKGASSKKKVRKKA
jgi:DNA topoisomerase I